MSSSIGSGDRRDWVTRIGSAIRSVRAFVRVPNAYWAGMIVRAGLQPRDVEFDWRKRRLVLSEFNLPITRGQAFVLARVSQIRALREMKGVVLIPVGDSEVLAEAPGFRVIVETEEELFILHELLVEGTYDFALGGPVVVWDVGMNVAFASLYFAAKDEVVAVHGFEPFPKTFDRAVRNIEANPKLKEKIVVHNVGVAATSSTVEADFCYEWKGTARTATISPPRGIALKWRGQSVERVGVEVRAACEALASVIRSHSTEQIVAKLDCEGAEYEVVSALSEGGLLDVPTLYMIEWHDRGPESLVAMLKSAGYACVSLATQAGVAGMVYATKCPQRVVAG
jgi:FkbM family methyltransferase